MNNHEHPHEGCNHEKYIKSCEQIILQAKLKVRKRKITRKVKHKRYENLWRKFLFIHRIKHRTIGDEDDKIQHCPHRTEQPRRWCPVWLNKCTVPSICCVHTTSVAPRRSIRRISNLLDLCLFLFPKPLLAGTVRDGKREVYKSPQEPKRK